MRLVADEGRHYLSTHADRYDVLQLSGVDSYSGTPGAAHVFSESYLYTEQAFDLYLSRLTDSGILNVMRLEHRFPREMLRALVTAVGSLRRAGGLTRRPRRHADRAQRLFTALLVKRAPFTPHEVARVSAWADANPFLTVSAAPGKQRRARERLPALPRSARPPARAGLRRGLPVRRLPRHRRPALLLQAFVLAPSLVARRAAAGHGTGDGAEPAAAHRGHRAHGSRLRLAALAARGRRAPRPFPGRTRFGLFFAAIGLGYFAIEIALLQRFGLFLGHPNYALSVVLAALLVATGAGALASERILRVLREIRYVAYALGIVVLIERLAVLPLLPVPGRARLRRTCRARLPLSSCPSVCCWVSSCRRESSG